MSDIDLGPLAQEAPPAVARRMEERRELFRRAAVSALANGGAHLNAEERRKAEHWARVKPLGRPLSTGEPARAAAHLEAAS